MPWRCVYFSPLLLALLLLSLTGCGSQQDDRLPVFPVAGAVAFGNQPLEGALIVLHPIPGADPRTLPARGYVDATGNFTLTTYEAGDGVAPGDYRVTVIHTPLVRRDGDVVAGPNVLPRTYATPESSDLLVSIPAEPHMLPPLQLKR